MDRAAKRDLAGLKAVVTGAAQGLGLGIARELGVRGAQPPFACALGAPLQLPDGERLIKQLVARPQPRPDDQLHVSG